MPDNDTSYCFNGIIKNTLDGVLETVTTGIMYIDNEKDYKLELIEEALQNIIINDDNEFPSWIEQSAFAYMFSKLKTYSSLHVDKYKFPYFQEFDLNNVEALHFVSYPECRQLWPIYMDRLQFKSMDPVLIKKIEYNVLFDVVTDYCFALPFLSSVPLTIELYDVTNHIQFKYKWGLPNEKYLSHIFKVNDIEYPFNSEYENSFYIVKTKELRIEHTYEWFGKVKWETVDFIRLR